MSVEASLTTVDYVVAVIILLVPVAIGIWYAVKDANRATRTEYLLGGRQMSMLPVALSIFVTYQSAVSVLGIPADVFYTGSIFLLGAIGISGTYVISYFTVLPLLYPLHLTSIYEYLKRRYRSEAVRLLSTVLGMINTLCYMAVALLTPALALQATLKIPLWTSVAVFGAVGTLYTAIGGIKSVVWTDAFQSAIVFFGLFAIIIKACLKVGGLGEVWRLSQEGGRTEFDTFSPDPRVRHTVWSLFFGFGWVWMVNIFSQSMHQRITSMKSLRDARLAILLNIPIICVYFGILCLTGLAIFAYYSFHKCDPKEGGMISNINQLAPYFVLHAMTDIPGMAGLFTSVLCCGALSTLSSGINALAANTVEDILQRPLRSLRESVITLITKLFVVLYGAAIIGLAYLARSLPGPAVQMASTFMGALGSPIVGIFVMGGAVPWANKFGAFAGVAVSFSINVWINLGNRLQGKPIKTLPSVGTEGCVALRNESVAILSMKYNDYLPNSTLGDPEYTAVGDMKDSNPQDGDIFFLFDITYEWYCIMGTIVCVVVGLMVSYITNRVCAGTGRDDDDALAPSEARYIFPCLRHFWGMDNPEVPCYSVDNEDIPLQEKKYTPRSDTDPKMHVLDE